MWSIPLTPYMSLAAIGWMVVALREAVPAHRRRYVVALLALALRVLGAAVSVGSASTLGASDLTGAGSVVTAAIWWWSGRRDAATSTVPITLPQVLAALGDAVLVVDTRGRLVHTNDAAQRMLLAGGAELVAGAHWTSLVPVSTADEVLAGNPLVTWNGRVIDVRRTPVLAAGRANGTVVVLRDVTQVAQLRQDLGEQAPRHRIADRRSWYRWRCRPTRTRESSCSTRSGTVRRILRAGSSAAIIFRTRALASRR